MVLESDRSSSAPLGLLVFGMHRSGTSALTGVLERLGIPVSGELLPAETYNEKGIFENRAVNAFHNDLLAHLGSGWDDPMPVSNAFVETPAGEGFVRRLADIIRDELLADAPIFAVKDPRMSRFVPLWRAAMARVGAEPLALLPLRHPLEVAASLARRDKFPRAKSLLLWLDHTLAAEAETRALRRTVLFYDALLADWRAASEGIAADLELQWPRERARAEAEIDAFLTRDLRHHAEHGAIGEGTRLDALVQEAWDALAGLVEDGADEGARERLDRVRDEVARASAVVAPYVAWEYRALADTERRARDLQFYLDARDNEMAAAREVAAGDVRAVRFELQAEQMEHARTRNEMAAIAAEAERLRPLVGQLHGAEVEKAQLRHEIHRQAVTIDTIMNSTSWRALQPVRRLGQSLPPGARSALREGARSLWWLVTPWRMEARREVMRAREALAAPPPPIPALSPSVDAGPHPVVRPRIGQPPLLVFEAPSDRPRVSMVTDSINEGSLFGGVATALIFSALFAQRTGRRLRIVTRTQPPAAENVAAVFRAHGITYDDNIEFAFADIGKSSAEVEVAPDELFITTSWWTTHSTLQSIADSRVIYLIQEDERMFYPFGDEGLLCAETMGHAGIAKVINSGLLHRHLVEAGLIAEDVPFFEPAFPERIYHPEPGAGPKKTFFFYARPNNPRNLYTRGLEVIERAVVEGVLDPAAWEIVFVGKDLQPMTLAGSVQPTIRQNMAWEEYAALTRSVDLGLTLMYTPHPSYPPLDIAACGGIAVTNRFGVKTDLSNYSRSILCVDGDVKSLLDGLREGVRLASDRDERRRRFEAAGLGRDWATSFAAVIETLAESAPRVR
ncbi:hypothetical protein [Aureimonas sp. SK2]|uniref:rhamnosyltransferase WsaF family glycosyltransferase n=1 Tax=Aureimonas sp. SK2 TaxID=3015992 RepID=UPI002444010E|nr:hypothetical protein [Aureimonas sp. SK2]